MFQRLAFLVLVFLFVVVLGATTIHSRSVAAQGSPNGSPIINRFGDWGAMPPDRRLIFYSGWSNGLFTTTKDPATLALGRCLENLSFEQIMAMIDRRYAEHREGFKNPISLEIINAVTAAGSPCESIKVGSDQ